jgi:hypothetical protein
MTDVKPPQSETGAPAGDPLARLHKMSTTAGLGTTEYVAVNGLAVVTLIMGVASSLSLMGYVLLAIPAVTIVLALMALHQIKDSNGTQTGKGLAILGLVLAVGFVAAVGGRAMLEIFRTRSDKQAINSLIEQFDQDIRAKKYDQAYGMFSAKFTSRIKPQNFIDRWKPLVEGTAEFSGLTDIKPIDLIEFETNPDTGVKDGYAMPIMEFGPKVPPARFNWDFSQMPDGSWKIANVRQLFPEDQPQQGGQRRR